MGRYTPLEEELSYLTSDEINELYLSGKLYDIYDEFERTGEIKIQKQNQKRKKKLRR